MMQFRRLKHTFLRLSTEEKVTLIGGVAVLISAFLPWYEVNLSIDEKRVIETGFSGDLGVIGFVIFIITLLAALTLTGEHLGFRMPTFGYQKERVILFLTGQSTFLLLLTLAVYTKRSFDFTSAEVRFGLYAAFIGALIATFSIYAMIQKLKKKDVEAFFGKEEEEEPLPRRGLREEIAEESILEEAEEPQMSFTEVEEAPQEENEPQRESPEDELDDVVEFTETTEVTAPEEAAEAADEVIEEVVIEEIAEEEPAQEEAPEEEPSSSGGKKPSGGPSLGFYDD